MTKLSEYLKQMGDKVCSCKKPKNHLLNGTYSFSFCSICNTGYSNEVKNLTAIASRLLEALEGIEAGRFLDADRIAAKAISGCEKLLLGDE